MPRLVRPFGVLARCLVLVIVALVIAVVALPPTPTHGLSSSATRLDWGVKAPMPTPRTGLGVVAASNGRLYAIGGFSSAVCGSVCSTVEEYDPATNTWASKAPMQARRAPGVAALPNGKLYAVGGANSSGSPLATVEEYDLASNVWTPKAPMPTPRSQLGLTVGSNGKLYAVGGTNGSPLQTVEEYDPIANTWRSASHGLTPMPTPRGGLGLVAASNGKLYAIGGVSPACPASQCAVVEEYDPTANTWRGAAQGLALMPTARETLGLAAAPSGRIYAIGGFRTGGGCPSASDCAVVEEYDPATNRWRGLADGLALMPTNRSSLGLAVAPNGRLYAIGGFNSVGVHDDVEEYDPATNSWASKPGRAALPATARHRAATAVANGRIYIFGGADGGGTALQDVWQYDPSTNGWDQKDNMPTARFGAAAATAPNGKIYVVGGEDQFGQTFKLLEEYTPPANGAGPGSWRQGPAVSQPTIKRTDLGFALASDGRLFAVGGREGNGYYQVVEAYDPTANTWAPPTSLGGYYRAGLGLALAGDSKLYAVGGGDPDAMTRVQRLTPPSTTWEGPGGIAQLPEPREYLGLVGAPNGNLYAVGGRITTTDPNIRHKADVFEYDHLASDWVRKASMPTARRAMSLGLVGNRLFAIAGFNGLALTINEEAVLDTLPTVSAGTVYTAFPGGSVQLSATGSDPDGDALSYAWDTDGDLLYETSGQSPVVQVPPNKPLGTYPLRARALDPKGGYAVASATLSIVCGPRPSVQTFRLGPGQIRAVVRAGTGVLGGTLQIGVAGRPVQNASVDVQGGPSGITTSQDVPISSSEVVLTVTRREGGAVTVPLGVTDSCGLWRTFVGFGPGV